MRDDTIETQTTTTRYGMRPPTKRQARYVMWCVACVPSPSPPPPPPPLSPPLFNRLRYNNIQVKMGTAHGSSGNGSGRKPRGKKIIYAYLLRFRYRYNIILYVPVCTCIICYKGSLFILNTLRGKNEFGGKKYEMKERKL